LDIGAVISFIGTVKGHRDNSTQMNRVKLVWQLLRNIVYYYLFTHRRTYVHKVIFDYKFYCCINRL
jgi:hypothetical protein